MSLYDYTVARIGSRLMAYVEIQNDYTGATVKSLKKIYERNGEYFIRADGRIHNITRSVSSLLMREDEIKRALEYYRTHGGAYQGGYVHK